MSFENEKIVLENAAFRLVLDKGGCAESLINLSNGEECLSPALRVPIFTVTEDRPFNNELKLTYMNKRTVFGANSLDWDGESLTVGFDLVSFQAVVRVEIKERYMRFVLTDFIADEKEFPQPMSYPPVVEFRLLQLPLPAANSFGQWMNVSHSERSSVAVMADSQYGVADSMVYGDTRILTLDARRGFKLRSCGAALICADSDKLLDAVDDLEKDMGLPRGVESRRSRSINASMYWVDNLTPENVDEHIAYAKKGGFRMMLVYFSSMFLNGKLWTLCGNYDYNDAYPNGEEDLRKVVAKIKAAGITPGFHFLHTHIGIASRYVTPIADHRLNLTRRFTLSRPIGTDDTEIYVEEPTADTTLCEGCRVLRFDGELISYEGYTEEYPYRFYGCKRGHFNTNVTAHARGISGGILDISEFGALSVYLDQNTDLLDEVGDKLAAAYNCGFEFVYFDGSEGTNPPYEFHISNAQYRMYRKMKKAPLFCEGAAKTHFGWHMLSGANAFDVFPTDIFKEMIIKHPFTEAELMQRDRTRVNFGWWAYREDTRADVYEFGTSKAAAWDCPVTVVSKVPVFKKNPRTDDILEVMRRWEDARATGIIDSEMKAKLRMADKEYTLLINAGGEYEFVEYKQVTVGDGTFGVRAFVFERGGFNYAVIWDDKGESTAKIPMNVLSYTREVDTVEIPYTVCDGNTVLPVSSKGYIKVDCKMEELTDVLRKAEILR